MYLLALCGCVQSMYLLIWNIYAKCLHFILELKFVVTQWTLEEVDPSHTCLALKQIYANIEIVECHILLSIFFH